MKKGNVVAEVAPAGGGLADPPAVEKRAYQWRIFDPKIVANVAEVGEKARDLVAALTLSDREQRRQARAERDLDREMQARFRDDPLGLVEWRNYHAETGQAKAAFRQATESVASATKEYQKANREAEKAKSEGDVGKALSAADRAAQAYRKLQAAVAAQREAREDYVLAALAEEAKLNQGEITCSLMAAEACSGDYGGNCRICDEDEKCTCTLMNYWGHAYEPAFQDSVRDGDEEAKKQAEKAKSERDKKGGVGGGGGGGGAPAPPAAPPQAGPGPVAAPDGESHASEGGAGRDGSRRTVAPAGSAEDAGSLRPRDGVPTTPGGGDAPVPPRRTGVTGGPESGAGKGRFDYDTPASAECADCATALGTVKGSKSMSQQQMLECLWAGASRTMGRDGKPVTQGLDPSSMSPGDLYGELAKRCGANQSASPTSPRVAEPGAGGAKSPRDGVVETGTAGAYPMEGVFSQLPAAVVVALLGGLPRPGFEPCSTCAGALDLAAQAMSAGNLAWALECLATAAKLSRASDGTPVWDTVEPETRESVARLLARGNANSAETRASAEGYARELQRRCASYATELREFEDKEAARRAAWEREQKKREEERERWLLSVREEDKGWVRALWDGAINEISEWAAAGAELVLDEVEGLFDLIKLAELAADEPVFVMTELRAALKGLPNDAFNHLADLVKQAAAGSRKAILELALIVRGLWKTFRKSLKGVYKRVKDRIADRRARRSGHRKTGERPEGSPDAGPPDSPDSQTQGGGNGPDQTASPPGGEAPRGGNDSSKRPGGPGTAATVFPQKWPPQFKNHQEFGTKGMGWGSGVTPKGVATTRAATARMTRQELKEMGMTKDIAEAWKTFYSDAVALGQGGAQAVARRDMFSRAVELLSE